MISGTRLTQLTKMIADGDTKRFYDWTEWRELSAEVMAMDHFECQRCKLRGRYSRAEIVHHVKHLKDRPDLALSVYDGHSRQLISLCRACHEAEHPERMRKFKQKAPFNVERWD